MQETQPPAQTGDFVQTLRTRLQAFVHVCVVFLTLVTIILYTSSATMPEVLQENKTNQTQDGTTPSRSYRFAPFKRRDISVPITKIYLHSAFTMPRTNFQLANMAKSINVESSRIVDIGRDTTFRWKADTLKALNLIPYNMVYGLAGIYVASQDGNETFTALLRMPRDLCIPQAASWTCQNNEQNKHFDNTYCVIVIASQDINELLKAAKLAIKTKRVDLTEPIVKGAFCGNPILQRIAAGQKAVFFLNHNKQSARPERDYMLCKYNLDTVELSQCIDIGVKSLHYNKPMAIIYDRYADSVLTIQYTTDNVLKMMAFDGQVLNFKALFKSLPSPSGYFVYSESFDGHIIFHGDLSLFEVDSVINLQSGRDYTIKPF